MTEELDSPALQIGTSERMFSVWLDDTLIYTDCPGLDNRIGYVTLPMNTAYRQEPIILSLPVNYAGKTLTIAQSTPTWSETPTIKAVPASVKLYCGYAYESGIVSESFSAAIAATAVFVLALFLLPAFVRNHDIGMLCIALSACLWMYVILQDVSFFTKYFGTGFISVDCYARVISAAALSVFLTLKAGRYKSVMRVIAGLQGVTILFSLLLYSRSEHTINRIAIFFMFSLMEWAALAGFLAVLVLGIGFWRKSTTQSSKKQKMTTHLKYGSRFRCLPRKVIGDFCQIARQIVAHGNMQSSSGRHDNVPLSLNNYLIGHKYYISAIIYQQPMKNPLNFVNCPDFNRRTYQISDFTTDDPAGDKLRP